jgi:hypothetical protein
MPLGRSRKHFNHGNGGTSAQAVRDGHEGGPEVAPWWSFPGKQISASGICTMHIVLLQFDDRNVAGIWRKTELDPVQSNIVAQPFFWRSSSRELNPQTCRSTHVPVDFRPPIQAIIRQSSADHSDRTQDGVDDCWNYSLNSFSSFFCRSLSKCFSSWACTPRPSHFEKLPAPGLPRSATSSSVQWRAVLAYSHCRNR